ELLDESDIAELPPLHKAFCRLDYVERHWVIVSVRRLQAAVPDLDEEDALEVVAQVGVFLAGLTWLS
uniref:hypothetical protein n=1 Tax=Anaerolinea sp. TaxID=1872519 RepID=UPI002ACD31D3